MRILKRVVSPADFLKAAERRRVARGGAPSERQAQLVRGLAVYAARFDAAGDSQTAKTLHAAAERAGELMREETEARASAEAVRPDFLGDAARDVAKGLMKSMPGAFTDQNEAAAWALRSLPLTEARNAAAAAADRAMKIGKRAVAAHREFQAIVEKAAGLATGEPIVSKALNTLKTAGLGL